MMTIEQKRIKLAEAGGWTEISDWKAAGINGKHPTESWVEVIPDYFYDLNAVHELEKILTLSQFWSYADRLNAMVDGSKGKDSYISATAAQRAEALGLTLKLWK
jgi:hypothetical protein